MSLEHTLSDGTVEQANSLIDAYERCPFLGRMTLEQAAVFIDIYERDDTVIEQNTNNLNSQAVAQEAPLTKNKDTKEASVQTVTRPVAVAQPNLERATINSKPDEQIETIKLIEPEIRLQPLKEPENYQIKEPSDEKRPLSALEVESTAMDKEIEIIIKREIPAYPEERSEPEKVSLGVSAINIQTMTEEVTVIKPEPLVVVKEEILSKPAVEQTIFAEPKVEITSIAPEVATTPALEVDNTARFDSIDKEEVDITFQVEANILETEYFTEVELPLKETTQTLETIILDLDLVEPSLALEPMVSTTPALEVNGTELDGPIDIAEAAIDIQNETGNIKTEYIAEIEQPLAEATQTLESIISNLDAIERNQVEDLLEQIEILVEPSTAEPNPQEPETISVEAELIDIAETLIKLLNLSDEKIEPKSFMKLIIQVLPDLKPMLMDVDLERDGTKEVKRRYLMKRGDDEGWAMLRLGQIIGMLVLLRSFVILPGQIYYQI